MHTAFICLDGVWLLAWGFPECMQVWQHMIDRPMNT